MMCRRSEDIARAAAIDGADDPPLSPEGAMAVALILAPYMKPASAADAAPVDELGAEP